MSRRLTALGTVFRRELATVLRTPVYGVLALGLLVVLGGLLTVGGGGKTGFLPTVVDLLLPTELLVPLLAVVLGYRALLTDFRSGELAVIQTYPVGIGSYAAGVLLARAVALLAVVGIPYAVVGGYVWVTAAPETGIFATHAGVDSPLLFVRFLAFVALLGLAYLSLSVALSTLVASRRAAIAAGILLLVAGVLGGDLAVSRALTGGTSPSAIPELLALTPHGAFRGLVFEHVIGVAFAPDGKFVATGRAVASLIGWSVAGVLTAVAALKYRRYGDLFVERLRSEN